MKIWLETSLEDLYSNTLRAFPTTVKRQNSVDEVKIEHLDWVPFKGVRTLFVKGQARRDESKNECIMLFKGIKYHEENAPGLVEIKASNGETVFVEPLSYKATDVLVRCTCKDFHWRMTHFNKMDGSLFGRDRKEYEALSRPGTSNPMEMAGLCKHLMKMSKVLSEASLLK
jgi:hypothetical protein